MHERKSRLLIAALELLVASALLFGVWVALPARWWPVDMCGSLLAILCVVGAIGLFAGQQWGRAASLVANWATLLVGLALVTTLGLTLAHLSGLYGPVGSGGALLMGLVAALVLPYLVGLPALQLLLLRKLR